MARKKVSALTTELRVTKANLRKAQSSGIKREVNLRKTAAKNITKERAAAARAKDALEKKYERELTNFKNSEMKKNKKRGIQFKQQIALLKECLDQAKAISAAPAPTPPPPPAPAPAAAPAPAPAPARTGTTVLTTPRPRPPYVHDLPPVRRVRRSLTFPRTLPPYAPEDVYDPMYPSYMYV